MEQAKEALKFVINNLREGDLFNIVAYDSVVESFRPELQGFNDETRKAALGFADSLYAGGSTNIDGALSTALAMIQDESRPNFIVFLTDGQPTAGETNEGKIVANSEQKNKLQARIVSFGVGYDVNSRLLDRLSRANYGQSEYVRPDENIEANVSRLYAKINSPVMTNVAVDIQFDSAPAESSAATSRIYPKKVYDLFAGEQLVLVGRYKKFGTAKVVIQGKTPQGDQKFDFPAQFNESSADQSYGFVEKLWAVRRIGEIIDELDLSGRNEELVKELIALSTRHGVLTPYTSFLADENARPTELADARAGHTFALDRLERLREAEGVAGFSQRAGKKAFQEAQVVPLASGLGGPVAESAADAPIAAGGAIAGQADPASAPGLAPAAPAGIAGGRVAFREIDSDKVVVADSVQIVGSETLYKRGKVWFAASASGVDLEKDADKIEKVERFTPKYFDLIAKNTQAENAVLARQQAGDELIIKLRGKVYRIQ
jgi:Ca-activated chloride channel family protein